MPSLRAVGIKSFFLQKTSVLQCFAFFCTLELNYGALFVKARFTQEVIEFNRRYIKKKTKHKCWNTEEESSFAVFTSGVWGRFMTVIWSLITSKIVSVCSWRRRSVFMFHSSIGYWLDDKSLPQRSETSRKTKKKPKPVSDDTFARITDLYFYSHFNQTHRLPRRAAYF